jgi:hypothetical protein
MRNRKIRLDNGSTTWLTPVDILDNPEIRPIGAAPGDVNSDAMRNNNGR